MRENVASSQIYKRLAYKIAMPEERDNVLLPVRLDLCIWIRPCPGLRDPEEPAYVSATSQRMATTNGTRYPIPPKMEPFSAASGSEMSKTTFAAPSPTKVAVQPRGRTGKGAAMVKGSRSIGRQPSDMAETG